MNEQRSMETNYNDRSTRRLLRKPPERTSKLGLASHVLPLVVLAIGMLWLMTTMPSAKAQNQVRPNFQQPRQNFQQPPTSFQQPGANYQQPSFSQPGFPRQNNMAPAARVANNSGIPSIPSAAMIEPQAETADLPPEDAEETESSGFYGIQMPAIASKIAQGGWLMLPLGICSMIVIALSLERLVALRRGRVIPRPFVRRFTECVEDGQLSYDEATEICKDFDCPVAEVFRAAVRRWGRPMFEIEQAVMDAGDRVSDGLRRFLRVFHAISNVAPLLGLLGTVLGMITAFEVISTQESIGRPEMLASGISTALMTTAGGLCVAIPAYLAYMYFSSKSDRYLSEIDKLCQRVVDCISAEGLEDTGSRRSKKRRAA